MPREAVLGDRRGVVRGARALVEFGQVPIELVADGDYEQRRARQLCGKHPDNRHSGNTIDKLGGRPTFEAAMLVQRPVNMEGLRVKVRLEYLEGVQKRWSDSVPAPP